MNLINIRDSGGKLRKNIAVERVPCVGELVRVGTEWQQVSAVLHAWTAAAPLVTIRLSPAPAQAAAMAEAE
jgi:hypothetical protein